MKKPLSLYHPALYFLRVWQRRLLRYIQWYFSRKVFSTQFLIHQRLPHRYIKHTSKLIRRLGGSDLVLQHNKVTNLKIAVGTINHILIRPNEYFSFCKLVGRPTVKRGFVAGMELSFGEARSGIGGGICQLSNLIHWMALHSPLQVVERANHSFDPFPDEGRVLPFGSGAAIFYNFVDLVLHNPTQKTFQLSLNVGESQLEGELLCNEEREVKYHVYQKNHGFSRHESGIYRQNQIWRDTITKGHHPQVLSSECLYENNVIVKYEVAEAQIEDII